MDAIYKGEVQFLNWSDNGNTGPKIVLALPDRKYLDNFVNSKSKRYAIMMVEIFDDESMPTKRERLGPLCEWAVHRCKESLFWEFLNNDPAFSGSDEVINEEDAKDEILFLCRSLQNYASAGQWFKRNIMGATERGYIGSAACVII